jgi:hypothetical protein
MDGISTESISAAAMIVGGPYEYPRAQNNTK